MSSAPFTFRSSFSKPFDDGRNNAPVQPSVSMPSSSHFSSMTSSSSSSNFKNIVPKSEHVVAEKYPGGTFRDNSRDNKRNYNNQHHRRDDSRRDDNSRDRHNDRQHSDSRDRSYRHGDRDRDRGRGGDVHSSSRFHGDSEGSRLESSDHRSSSFRSTSELDRGDNKRDRTANNVIEDRRDDVADKRYKSNDSNDSAGKSNCNWNSNSSSTNNSNSGSSTDNSHSSSRSINRNNVVGDKADKNQSISFENIGKLRVAKEYYNLDIPDEAKIVTFRKKQVSYGKNTVGYDNYIAAVPRNQRKGREHPRSPDPLEKRSKRCFDGAIKNWRIQLHLWDDKPEDKSTSIEPSIASSSLSTASSSLSTASSSLSTASSSSVAVASSVSAAAALTGLDQHSSSNNDKPYASVNGEIEHCENEEIEYYSDNEGTGAQKSSTNAPSINDKIEGGEGRNEEGDDEDEDDDVL